MVAAAKVCDLTEDLLWFVCGLYVGILMSSLRSGNREETRNKGIEQVFGPSGAPNVLGTKRPTRPEVKIPVTQGWLSQ